MPTKTGNNFKVYKSILVPCETSEALIDALQLIGRRHYRVTINYGTPDTGEAWYSETGYVCLDPVGENRYVVALVSHRNGETAGQVETDAIVSIEHANKRDGGQLWPLGQKQLFEDSE